MAEVVTGPKLRLFPEEVAEIRRRLGREPNPVEWRVFEAMWSEHCSYKHSRPYLRVLPGEGPGVLRGPGGNAGVVEIAPGVAVAMKIESHNHPSAVDPFHGAATGVGGILRDVLSMGARPTALLDSLRFGEGPRSRRLLEGVVAGIAHYGNAVGVPVVGGEVHIEPCYTQHPLVNVCCVGILRSRDVRGAAAGGPGNVVLYAGARTGRDGIGGAAFASEELDAESALRDRSAVQIGDPLAGKLLIEATLEAYRTGAVVAVQDMGAAGLACAAAEMSARGGVGMRIDLAQIPRREAGMRPEEVLLSESQERMLLVVERGREEEVAGIYRRWGLLAQPIGVVTEEKVLRVYDGDRLVVELPPELMTGAPERRVPERPYAPPPLHLETLPEPEDPAEVLLRLLRAPGVHSKRWIYTQYDHLVQINTVVGPGSDAAVLRIKEASPLGIALSVDGPGRIASLDPWCGGAWAVCEAALNVACSGARPVAVTDGLNLASPEQPEVAWSLRRVLEGIADACRALGLPVIGGNVSLYNESTDRIYPTPIVAVLGVLRDVARAVPSGFRHPGDRVVLVGALGASLAGSTYLKEVHGLVAGAPPAPDLGLHARLVGLLVRAAEEGLVRSAHDLSDGGLGVALAEACILGEIGAGCDLSLQRTRVDELLFGEGPSRVVVTVPGDRYETFCALCREHRVPVQPLGRVGGDTLRIRLPRGGLEIGVSDLREAWEG
ncbi:MAG: phosphoribosylformylglycinamidine synthase subunit PurL [Armatimonadota bacterium]|nr:phosphoribosylformylglycinamidine synthase subunit PurL [Armatimonadota bacterium]MDR7561985.1 phosphoribosylformylglycinamidine synthase subunit PurL [Armatimonadota bacterium]MDR7602576.1 phosphoribosylformylglycinamidine synthase subunit PurL [Armatimonadota bacterium]